MEIDINGVTIRIEGADAAQTVVLTDTLARLWVHHLRLLPTITAGDRPARGGGGAAHSGMPGGPYIRLNRSCFQSPWNQHGYNYTLLHEVGHIVDWAFDCMHRMRREDNAGFRALLAHPHSGATQGWSEHYADGVADFYAGKPMAADRRNAILFSRGFFGPIGIRRPTEWAGGRRIRWEAASGAERAAGDERCSYSRMRAGGSATARMRGNI